ncbi:MAG: hypothetical protein E6R13_04125 [Spirochaetes bacterium]|nr:MAG: hypothetical protein E6R13_04125 [Spirochaetota bacterium]
MDKARIYVKSLILSQLLIDANDDLEGTPFYDTRLKTDVKRLEKTLIKAINKQFMVIYNQNPELMHNIMRKVENLIAKLSSCQIDDLTMLETVLDNYLKDPEWFLNNVDPEFIPLRK